MPRRNLVPLLLLAVLAVLTAVFAVVGARSAPTAPTIQVQNAAEMTFGTPTGATSWLLALTLTATTGIPRSEENLIRYLPPDRMLIYSVSGRTPRLAGAVPQVQIPCVLSAYAALLQGPGSWKQNGEFFTRTESLADYTARVPVSRTVGGACVPHPSTAPGEVHETAVVRSGYLIGTRAQIVPPPAQGIQSETRVFLRIGDVRVTTLKKS